MDTPLFSPEEESLIRQEAARSEAAGTLSEPLLALAEKKRLYHLSVPESMGGLEMPVPDQLEVYRETSLLDGSFGWTMKLGASAGIFSGFMDRAFAGEIYRHPRAFTAGSGFPAGTARPDGNHYVVSGRWKYISGIHHATLFTASCVVEREDSQADEPEIRAMAFLPDEITPLDTWNGYGLKASASHDFTVENLRIPKERSFVLAPRTDLKQRPLYNFPFMAYAPAAIAASMLGMSQAFLEEAEAAGVTRAGFPKLREELSDRYISLQESVGRVWQACENGQAGEEHPLRTGQVEAAAKELARLCRETAAEVYRLSGMKVLDETTRFNRTWRDLMTAGQHVMVN
jgi:indole-3-acetate monooxygenase